MVNRAVHIYLPHSKLKLSATHLRLYKKGRGMGSVLLSTGGPGGASSYSGVDDYIHTTHMNPYTHQKVGKGLGLGMLTKKLQSLNVKPIKPMKSKNISFSLS
jgi:hypothetical protein